MNLSPEQKQKVVATVAALLVDELRAELGGTLQSLFVVPLAVAETMTGLSRNTLRAVLPVVELSAGKHGVRLSTLQEYIERKTSQPLAAKKRGAA